VLRLEVHPPRPQETLEVPAFHEATLPDGTPWTEFYRSADGYMLRFPGFADFEVSTDGAVVHCWSVPDVSESTVRHLYQNQVWPMAHSRQGRVFHASAVDVQGWGVAFMAESGRGKSTLAGEFASRGFRFLTDDGLVLDSVAGILHVVPSFPSIRLWQDSHEALLPEVAPPAQDVQYTSKVRMLAGDDLPHCTEPRPLGAVYFLGEGTAQLPEISPLKPGDALIELAKHSFLLDVESKEHLARQFQDLARMVNESIYYRLDYPRRYEDLPRVRTAVLEHVLAARADQAGG
jgi:hypothetical protein